MLDGAANNQNPYADSLKGLAIEDPVAAFFDWCREREAIRSRRAAGNPPPWSEDPVFQKGRFLNVFREDDPGTQAVLRFADPVKSSPQDLIHALFFARWCNRSDTLDAIHPGMLKNPEQLRETLLNLKLQPWESNVYPVVPVTWDDRKYDRLEACIKVFPCCIGFLESCVLESSGNVITATQSINSRFRMTNDFPIFMALTDLALLKPDMISPDSPVPSGIGAVPFLDLLQHHLHCENHPAVMVKMIELQPAWWPEARRPFTPIDIEYICCECRKYYSYINETKSFDGKNRYIPNRKSTDDFLNLSGSWEDEKSAEEIIAEIKTSRSKRNRFSGKNQRIS